MPPLAPMPQASAWPVLPSQGRTALLPEALHPALWRAQAGSRSLGGEVLSSGFPALDAELPGGGWPLRTLTELLLAQPGLGEFRLLAPALVPVLAQGRGLMLLAPPAEVSAEALRQLGLPPERCIVVRAPALAGRSGGAGSAAGAGAGAGAAGRRSRSAADELCWALEQALRSGQLGAVMAWPGPLQRPEALRRLQLAAQSHAGPAFVLRELAARIQPSPAPLRLALHSAGPDHIQLQLFKRRGPALAQPLSLALAPVLSRRGLLRSRSAWPATPATERAVAGGADVAAMLGSGMGAMSATLSSASTAARVTAG